MKPTCRRRSTSTGRSGSPTPGCTAAFISSPPQATGEFTLHGCGGLLASSFLFPQLQRWGGGDAEAGQDGSHARGRPGGRLAAPSGEMKQILPVNPQPSAFCFLNSIHVSIRTISWGFFFSFFLEYSLSQPCTRDRRAPKAAQLDAPSAAASHFCPPVAQQLST